MDIASIVFACAGVVAIWSLVTLGKSFAIFPSLRRIVTYGPYRWLRHPAYAAELVMIGACCFASPSWPRALIFLFAAAFAVLRIRVEEHLLLSDDAYQAYPVRWRLLPGVW